MCVVHKMVFDVVSLGPAPRGSHEGQKHQSRRLQRDTLQQILAVITITAQRRRLRALTRIRHTALCGILGLGLGFRV